MLPEAVGENGKGYGTYWTRIFVAVYAYDIALVIILYTVFPLYQRKLVADIPGFVDNPVFYWIFWALEAVVLSAGSLTYFSLMAYHIEICVLLVPLYRFLCNNFEGSASWGGIRSCVDIHRRFIEATKMFDVMFSRSHVVLVAIGFFVIVASMAVILFSVYPEPFFVHILLCFLVVFGTELPRGPNFSIV